MTLSPISQPAEPPSTVCSLQDDEAAIRIVEWRQVIGVASSTERTGTRARVVFAPSAEVTTELARLCAAETACCPSLTFKVAASATDIVLTIEGPPASGELMGRLLGAGG